MRLNVKFQESKQTFDPKFEEDLPFETAFGETHIIRDTQYVGGEPYTGAYDIIPKVSAQTLPTKEKVMLDDVTIRAIPIYETSNTSGGSTVYIAKEV